MKFIVFLAAPHMDKMPFLQSCEAMEYALAATHSEVLLLCRQTNRIRCQLWTVPLEEPSYRRVYTQDPCQIYESNEKRLLQYVIRNQVVKLPRRTTKTEKLASTFDESFTLYFINFKRRVAVLDLTRVLKQTLTLVMLRGYQTGMGGWRFCSGNRQSGLEIGQKA